MATGNLKTKEELEVEFQPNQQQAISAQSHLDLIESSVGVSATAEAEPQTIGTGNGGMVRSWRRRGDGGSVRVDETVDGFVIPEHGDGNFIITVNLDIEMDKNTRGTAEILKNGASTGIIEEAFTVDLGVPKKVTLTGGIPCVANDVITVRVSADNPTAVITAAITNSFAGRL